MAPARSVDLHAIPSTNGFQDRACRRASRTGIRLLCVRGLEPGRLRAAALDIGERRSLALTLYQTDFTINHVINVMEHEHPSLFSFCLLCARSDS